MRQLERTAKRFVSFKFFHFFDTRKMGNFPENFPLTKLLNISAFTALQLRKRLTFAYIVLKGPSSQGAIPPRVALAKCYSSQKTAGNTDKMRRFARKTSAATQQTTRGGGGRKKKWRTHWRNDSTPSKVGRRPAKDGSGSSNESGGSKWVQTRASVEGSKLPNNEMRYQCKNFARN